MLQLEKSQNGQPTSNVTQSSRIAKTVNSNINPKRQRLTQIAAAARSTLKSQIQRLASRIVPKNADLENRTFGRVSGLFDLLLTKVNAGQSLLQKP